jgi:type I restriction enzyme S subunit
VTTDPEQSEVVSRGTLSSVLANAGRPLRIPELFSMANYDRDSTEDVERFYLQLRVELGSSIRVADEAGENALLEVITDASR